MFWYRQKLIPTACGVIASSILLNVHQINSKSLKVVVNNLYLMRLCSGHCCINSMVPITILQSRFFLVSCYILYSLKYCCDTKMPFGIFIYNASLEFIFRFQVGIFAGIERTSLLFISKIVYKLLLCPLSICHAGNLAQ